MWRAICLEAHSNVKREMRESFGDLVARQPREPQLRSPGVREEPGQYSQPARSRQVHSRNADERETLEGATPVPEGPSPHRVTAGAWKGQGKPSVAGPCRTMVLRCIAARPLLATLEEAGVGRRASWVPQYEGIEGARSAAQLLGEDAPGARNWQSYRFSGRSSSRCWRM